MAVIIDGSGFEKCPKSGGREVIVRGGSRRNIICVSGSAVVGGEAWRRRGPCKRLGGGVVLLFLIWIL